MSSMVMLVRCLRMWSCSRRCLSAAMAGMRGMLGYILVMSKDFTMCVSGMVNCDKMCLRWRESWTW
jgi:hypothetical protein